MRILHLIPSISLIRGGPSTAVLSMVAELRHQGVDASILTTNDDGIGVEHELPLGRWHHQEAFGQAIPVLAFGRWSPAIPALREFAIAPSLTNWLGKNSRNYDLVHVHALFSYTTSVGMAQLRKQGVPYILHMCGQLNRWSLSQSRMRKLLFLKLLDRANLQGARYLHFTSESEREEVSDLHLSTPSFVLPLGVPALPQLISDTQNESKSNVPTRLLFLSRLHPKKQLPLLFDALSELKKQHPFRLWQLDIAGDGDPDYVQQLYNHCDALGLNSQVRWHGFIEGEAKHGLLQQADWFVLPSASENFGIAAAEALMAGTPVVLSPGVALASDVKAAQAGLVCDPSVEALAVCLEQCLDPPPLRMRQAAWQLADQHFSWSSICRQLINHYEEISRG